MSKVMIIGAGAAGMMAAIAAAYNGNEVHVFEKNEKAGKKLYITGKGRCNITNASDVENHFSNVMRNSKFLYGAYNCMDSAGVCALIESAGVRVKVERGKRVFPQSDKSSDVIKALTGLMDSAGVQVHLNCNIADVSAAASKVYIRDDKGNLFTGDKCIIATGGLSYPSTGSTGDGYLFAKKFGHTVEPTFPSLTPFNIKEECCRKLQGVSLRNVELTVRDENGKKLYCERGEMMFTHFGITGPLVLSASSIIADCMSKNSFTAEIDFKPALDKETLDRRILREFNENINKNFNNAIEKLLPKKIIPFIIDRAKIDPYKKTNEITKAERERLCDTVKRFSLTILSVRNYNEAIITRGGISVKEINPKTMESKIAENIYFAGEVLDLDAMTGGYNLQIAWSTGYLAGQSAGC